MSDDTTWVVLTDGYYIRIMFYKGQKVSLNTYRDGDFEKSSEITYKLITRERNTGDGEIESTHRLDHTENKEDYLFELLPGFLSEHAEINTYESLILTAPDSVIKKLKSFLPEVVVARIKAFIPGDYLYLSQDRLEEVIGSNIDVKNLVQ